MVTMKDHHLGYLFIFFQASRFSKSKILVGNLMEILGNHGKSVGVIQWDPFFLGTKLDANLMVILRDFIF